MTDFRHTTIPNTSENASSFKPTGATSSLPYAQMIP